MNLRTVKTKIKSIGNVGQITKAMQLVSAVKMKKAQEKAFQSRPYQTALQSTINNLLGFSETLPENPLSQTAKFATKKLAVIIASNKGLCGVYHFNLFRFIISQIDNWSNYEFVVMGGKAEKFIFHYGGKIIADFSKQLPFINNVTALYTLAKDGYLAQKYQSVTLFYNSFVNSMVFKPMKVVLLPLSLENLKEEEQKGSQKTYLVEPTPETVINGLFNFYLENEILNAVYNSEAAEHSARMVAMKNATDNSRELVYRLTLYRNHIRQEKITNELLDMNTAKLAVT